MFGVLALVGVGRVSVNERRGRDEVRCALESVPIDYSCNQQID